MHTKKQENMVQRTKIELQKPTQKKYISMHCNKQFKITIINMLVKPKKNPDIQLSKTRKITHEQNENINKGLEIDF